MKGDVEMLKKGNKILAAFVVVAILLSQVMPVLRVYGANDSVRLATFNIAANKKPNIEQLNSLLEKNSVDIVGLQEVDINTSRNNYDMLAKFEEQGTYPYSSFQKAIDYSGGEYGIGLLSKFALTNQTGGPLDSTGIDEARAWQKVDVEINGKTVAVYNTHLTFETVEAKAKQMKELIEIMDNDPTEYKVLFGDFNVDQDHSEIYPFLENTILLMVKMVYGMTLLMVLMQL